MDRLVFKHIDFDLAERIMASGSIKRPQKIKIASAPRTAATYRGARRNAIRERRAAEIAAKRAKKARAAA